MLDRLNGMFAFALHDVLMKGGWIADDRVVFPRVFPEFVADLEVLVGDLVAVVMRGLLVLAGAAEFRGQPVARARRRHHSSVASGHLLGDRAARGVNDEGE